MFRHDRTHRQFPNQQASRTPRATEAHIARRRFVPHPPKPANEEKWPRGSAQPIEKAQFRQENPRKSKLFSLIGFARAWPGFAGFG
jgi:hypothetical protein